MAERGDGMAGRTVIVTGAGTGMGRAISRRLVRGANVVVVGRREAALRELAGGGDGRVQVVPADITRPGTAEQIVIAAAARFGTVHGPVNNAGLAHFAPLEAGQRRHARAGRHADVGRHGTGCRAIRRADSRRWRIGSGWHRWSGGRRG